jgi:hypothetical protein
MQDTWLLKCGARRAHCGSAPTKAAQTLCGDISAVNSQGRCRAHADQAAARDSAPKPLGSCGATCGCDVLDQLAADADQAMPRAWTVSTPSGRTTPVLPATRRHGARQHRRREAGDLGQIRDQPRPGMGGDTTPISRHMTTGRIVVLFTTKCLPSPAILSSRQVQNSLQVRHFSTSTTRVDPRSHRQRNPRANVFIGSCSRPQTFTHPATRLRRQLPARRAGMQPSTRRRCHSW